MASRSDRTSWRRDPAPSEPPSASPSQWQEVSQRTRARANNQPRQYRGNWQSQRSLQDHGRQPIPAGRQLPGDSSIHNRQKSLANQQSQGNRLAQNRQQPSANWQPQGTVTDRRQQSPVYQQTTDNTLAPRRQPSPALQRPTPSLQAHSITSSNHRSTSTSRQAHAHAPAWRHARQSSHAEKMLEYTVQLVLDPNSIVLWDQSHAAFEGHPPPAHHSYTAIHAYLEHICRGLGGGFADVWLDTAHITLGAVRLPAAAVKHFKADFTEVTATLPSLTSGCYKITSLQHYAKPHRRDISTKGGNFYFFKLDLMTSEFANVLYSWYQALHSTVLQLGGWVVDPGFRRMQEHHMTIRSFSLRTAADSFAQVARAVQVNPATMGCLGIRIQQSVDQALEEGTDQALVAHGYFYQLQARYPVPLYTSCEAASRGIVRTDTQHRMRKKDAAIMEAIVDDVLDKLLEHITFG